MKYKRNWPYESIAEVEFENGRIVMCECQTNQRGRLRWIKIREEIVLVDEEGVSLKRHGVVQINFTTPNVLVV